MAGMRVLRQRLIYGAILAIGCSRSSPDKGKDAPAVASIAIAAERSVPPLKLLVVYGSEKKSFMAEAVAEFNRSAERTNSGHKIVVEASPMGSGEAVQAIVAGASKPHVFSPASGAYISLLNRGWLSVAGHTKPISPAGEPIVLSPVVIGIWKPMAEALGWPKKQLGWSDLIKVSIDPKGWASLGHAEWGSFKFGHTHPEFSTSGLLALLAETYAGAKKTRGLELTDLSSATTRNFVRSVERSVVHYGKSTGFFADKMIERGPAYLSAAVLYENLIVESYSKQTNAHFPLVALYPREGTFWSDHPFATLDAEWVGAEEREAAKKLLEYLKARPRQERALALGFRPADSTIPIARPIDAEHGVDPKQPQTLLEVPDANTLDALLTAFRELKKPADVVLVFDKSGSMSGEPLRKAKAGASAFLKTLADRDSVSLLFFDNEIHSPIGPFELASHRDELLTRIDQAIASGGTALYDATLKAKELLQHGERTNGSHIKALVVMTDGKDESSRAKLEQVEAAVRVEDGGVGAIRVFTIAYGGTSEASVLGRIAEAGQGSTASGDTSTIVEIYKDMAAFF